MNLKKKKWKGSQMCALCGEPENEDHIFFKCGIAKFTRACIKEMMGWERAPTGVQDFMNAWAKGAEKNYNLIIFGLACVLWGLWTTRNKCAIEGVCLTQPAEISFKINSLLQKWRSLLKEEEQAILGSKINIARRWVENFIRECRNRTLADFM